MKIFGISFCFKKLFFTALILSVCQGFSQTPACAALSIPANGSNGIALDINFEWVAAARAESYIIIAGTTSGGTDILDNFDAGNVTSYDLPNNLPLGQTIYVKIVTQNSDGQNQNCAEISFTTTTIQVPGCVVPTVPADGSMGVPNDIMIEWPASLDATGYRLTMGSSSGGNDILNDFDVGSATSYQLPGGFADNTSVFLKITPYNGSGGNVNCSEILFNTASTQVPDCIIPVVPANGSLNVPNNTVIEWPISSGATGYRLTIGSSSGGNDILDDFNVGDVTSYQHPGGFAANTSVFLKITPYNASGRNDSCQELQFTTTGETLPGCVEIIHPQDGDELINIDTGITWIQDLTATGYLLTIRKNEPDGEFILQDENVGNITNYKPPNFEPRTKYFITVIPYNGQGRAGDCEAIMFTTSDPLLMPECTLWIYPENGALDILPDVTFEWNAVPNTDGFILSIGTSPNGTDILNNEDVGNTTSFNLSQDLPIGTTIYVKINTYRGNDVSEDCQIVSFTVKDENPVELQDEIPKFFTPNNDGFNDVWTVRSSEALAVESFFVFDRYGKLVRQLIEGQNWDGTFNGKELPADTYWYVVELANAPSLKGYFLLKR